MAQTSYPDSDDEQKLCTQVPPVTSKHLSFIHHWVDTTVGKEILRGRELRANKPRIYATERDYDVINIGYQKPPSSRKTKYQGKPTSNKFNPIKTKPCSTRSKSPFPRSSSPSKTYNSSTRCTRLKYLRNCKTRKCPMRIAELAVPTKRQCINTWRAKNDILPGYMVERLRQQIMDEKPIVKIPDAIHYFRRRKPALSKSNQNITYDLFVNKQKKRNSRKMHKELKHAEIKELCILFGHKIAQKLIKPLNIILNKNLSNLSEVIYHDMLVILEKQKEIPTNNMKYRTIQAEMANKVAFWIDSILEDSSYKLIEEDLKDLEGEEGPVLDFLDDVMDNVLNICVPIPAISNYTSSQESTFTEHSVIKGQLEKNIIPQYLSDVINAYPPVLPSTSINSSENEAQINKNSLEKSPVINSISVESAINNEPLIIKRGSEKYLSNEITPEEAAIYKNIPEKDSNHESMSEIILENIPSNINETENKNQMNNKSLSEKYLTSQITPEEAAINKNISEEDSVDESISGIIFEDIPSNINENQIYNESLTEFADEEDALSELIRNELRDIVLNINEKCEGNLGKDAQERADTDLGNRQVINEDFMEESEHANLEVKSSARNSSSSIKELNQSVPDDVTLLEISLQKMEYKDDFGDGNSEESDILETAEQKGEDNVSEIFNFLNEESGQDRNKKVKFYETNIVTEEDSLDSVSQSIKNLHQEIIQYERDRLIWKSSSGFFKPHIELQPPNERILSDADELWPKEISSPVLKPSASVSKSITSLGKILESDEKLLPSRYINIIDSNNNKLETDKISNGDDIQSRDKNNDSKTNRNLNPVYKTEIESETTMNIKDFMQKQIIKEQSSYELEFKVDDELQALIEEFLHKDVEKGDSKISSSKAQHFNETIIMETDLAGGEKPFVKTSNETILISNAILVPHGDSDIHITKDKYEQKSVTGVVLSEIEHNVEIQQNNNKEGSHGVKYTIQETNKRCPSSNSKRDYRVYPLTAPSWVMRGRDEPVEKSVTVMSQPKTLKKLKEIDICKWIKDLSQGFVNLRMWSVWLDSTCKIILDTLKKKGVLNSKRTDVKSWIALKKNIDKDANLRTKLNQRTQENFKYLGRIDKRRNKIVSTEYYLCVKKDRIAGFQSLGRHGKCQRNRLKHS